MRLQSKICASTKNQFRVQEPLAINPVLVNRRAFFALIALPIGSFVFPHIASMFVLSWHKLDVKLFNGIRTLTTSTSFSMPSQRHDSAR